MNSYHRLRLALSVLIPFVCASHSLAQTAPGALTLTAKLRDFREINPLGAAPVDSDFNNDAFMGCSDTGYVEKHIRLTGDSSAFLNDNRTPRLVRTRNSISNRPCYNSIEKFEDWYNDRDTSLNRPFLFNMPFTQIAGGLYQYQSRAFFPLDDAGDKLPYPGSAAPTFGQLQTCTGCAHDYGFTMEFHAPFTYLAGKNQVFSFYGDDDVWVFINDSLVIDLGGQHGGKDGSVNLDTLAAAMGMVDHQSYMLDFFFAERHTVGSNCKITTSLVLGQQKVATPIVTPPDSVFLSNLRPTLSTPTPDAIIYYTLDGTAPDSNSARYDTATSLLITSNTVLKAIAYKSGWTRSDVLVKTYSKNFVASTLDILDENGNPVLNGYLTDLNASYRVRLVTTQAGLGAAHPVAATAAGLDRETLTSSHADVSGDYTTYTSDAAIPLAAGAATAIGNGRTESAAYDTLTVRWANPFDSTRDVAVKKVPIRPHPQSARLYFSFKADGSDTVVDMYHGDEANLYVFVIDEQLPAALTPSVVLESTPKLGSGRTGDKDTLALIAVSPGVYRAIIPVDAAPAAKPGDKKLQIVIEDQVKATYTDPQDGDQAFMNVGFGIAPEIDALLRFTDKDGNPLTPGAFYNPAAGSLYLTYKDDYANGAIATKDLVISVVNKMGGAASDSETFTLALNAAKRQGATGVWEAVLPLQDGPAITVGDKKVETYWVGQVTVRVVSHTKTGAPAAAVADQVTVAYANQAPQLSLQSDKGPAATIGRADAGIRVLLQDQSLSSAADTLFATLSCTESKDLIGKVALIETAPASGQYSSALIPRQEGPAAADGTLQCSARDVIKATYDDPVYGDHAEARALLDDAQVPALVFSATPDGSSPITSSIETGSSTVYAVLTAASPTVDKADTIWVAVTTPQGDKENFPAVETGAFTGIFVAKLPFGFTLQNPVANDGILEGHNDVLASDNRVTATATALVGGATAKSDLVLISAMDAVVKAYIKDVNGDGTADHVFLQFAKKLDRLPDSLSAEWSDTLTVRSIAGAKLSFWNGDSTLVVADFSAQPFPAGKTVPAAGQSPAALLPADPVFSRQTPALEDSLGPQIISAVKHPANPNAIVAGSPLSQDTLVITLSEPLKSGDGFKQMLKFATGCDDYAHAVTLTAMTDPTVEGGLIYTVLVDNSTQSTPQTGNCIFLNADGGQLTDASGNPPSPLGAPLRGQDLNHLIQQFRGYPPVAGLDVNSPAYQIAVQDSHDPDHSGIATTADGIQWIPPVGFDENDVQNGHAFSDYIPSDLKAPAKGGPDATAFAKMPPFISTVQVVSTARYVVYVNIFDNLGNFVRAFQQSFGYQGEMSNANRVVPKGLVSYLVWDMKDAKGQLAGQGVYVWKADFHFDSGKELVQYTRTGIVRLSKP